MVEKICIGTAQFGMSYGINNKIGKVNQSDIDEILSFAYTNHIKSIDTAKSYGDSENKIGSFIKNNKNDWDITTKVSDLNQSLQSQINDSTAKLGCKPTSLLAHNTELFLSESFQKELKSVKNKGLINKVGLSLYTNNEIELVLKYSKYIDIIQLPINILDTRLIKNGAIQRIYNSGIEIQARSIFLQGMFFMSDLEINRRFNLAFEAIQYLKKIIKDEDISLPEYSLLFVLRLEQISKVVIGLESVSQLTTNIKTLNKNVNSKIFQKALTLNFKNDLILNPVLWK